MRLDPMDGGEQLAWQAGTAPMDRRASWVELDHQAARETVVTRALMATQEMQETKVKEEMKA